MIRDGQMGALQEEILVVFFGNLSLRPGIALGRNKPPRFHAYISLANWRSFCVAICQEQLFSSFSVISQQP